MAFEFKESVSYAGSELPQDRVAYVTPSPNLANNPSSIVLGNIYLPGDTEIYINGEKLVFTTSILDGPPVTVRISSAPNEIEFEGTVRERDYTENGVPGKYIFPQTVVNELWANVWVPGSVQVIKNTFVNGLGISQLIVRNINISTVRGTNNVMFRLRCYENIPGESLIIK